MHETVGDGAGRGGVVEEVSPILEGQIGGDDGCRALIAAIEELVEQIGAARVEAEVAELVDEDEIWASPEVEASSEGVSLGGGDKLVDEIGGEGEADGVAADASELAEGVGEVGLADAARADEDAVGLLLDEVECGGLDDEVAIDLVGVVEVVGVERRQGKDPRALDRGTGGVLELNAKLTHQMVERGGWRVVTSDRLLGGGIELGGGVLEIELAEHVEEGELGDGVMRQRRP